MNTTFSVTGLQEIDSVFKALPLTMSHKILQDAHAKAAEPLVHREHLLAPVGLTGNLADSIGAVKTPYAKAGVIGEVIVGPRRSRQFKGHHAHLVESGTKKRHTKKGANRGVMPAQPFAGPAFKQTSDQVISRISDEVGRSVWRTMKRFIK